MHSWKWLSVVVLSSTQIQAQDNVGIGTTMLNRAKLTVVGTADANSSTVALFGGNAGISLQQNWPTIGFNQYRAAGTGFGTAISTGYGMHMTFNYTNGDFAMYRNGYASTGASFNQQNEILAYLESGYKLRLLTALTNSQVEIPNKLFSAQSGKMNLVPLGVIKISMTYFQNSGLQVTASNLAGTIMASASGSTSNNTHYLTLTLQTGPLVGYDISKTVIIPGLNLTHANTNDLFSLETSVLYESPLKIRTKVFIGNPAGSFEISGNIMVYGQVL